MSRPDTDPAGGAIIQLPSGVRLCYESIGSDTDPTLLLIEGHRAQMIGWRREFCHGFVDAGLRVIRFDNRDTGYSQSFTGTAYTLADMAQDVAGLIDTLACGPVHLVGQSMGGMIAQILALRSPDRVASLALLYSTPSRSYRIEREPSGPDTSEPGGIPALAADRARAIEQFVDGQITRCGSTGFPPDRTWLRELAAMSLDRGFQSAGLARQADAIRRSPEVSDELGSLRMPTTILHGSADKVINPEASHRLHALIPDSTLTTYDGMGHELPQPLWGRIRDQILTNTTRADPTNGNGEGGHRLVSSEAD